MIQNLLSAFGVYKLYRAWLHRQIDLERLPEHIGIILDGNRRWASARDMIPWQGHREGAAKVREFLEWCLNLGIKTVTLYAFSTENFSRSETEVEELMKIYEENLKELLDSEVIHEHQVRVSVIGRTSLLPVKIQGLIDEMEELTKDYDRFYLNIALAYGGRAEIVDALKQITDKVKNGEIDSNDIDEKLIEDHLYTSYLPKPDPDLIIRTSGEARISNFLIWQAAYSEFFLVDVFWPEFREIDLERAIRSYQNRQRRYGS
ncbi:MAG: di-trans,poly-cis-decaprenylcistransferase [Candidatus Bathyarchaeota archaeon]|nr:MAG: di-trans,poly-cis-decaprenylcistransferase [Candidatus Bathyarchaeota archaeon]